MKHVLQYNPFFLIVDDGGFDYAVAEKRLGSIGLETYENIAALGKEFGVKIPVCFTMKYLDKENISGKGEPLGYTDDLVAFLKENGKHIEIGYHGLTHEYHNHTGEFYCLDTRENVPENIQNDHMQKSEKIFKYWGLAFPELFVPPYHGWEWGVTDKIAAEHGVKYLVSYQRLRVRGHSYAWKKSGYLDFFPRTSLGLNGEDVPISLCCTKSIFLLPRKKLIDFAWAHVISPCSGIGMRLRIYKTFRPKPVHSYMTHIGNFSGKGSLDFWRRVFERASLDAHLCLCRSNAEAADVYKEIASEL